MNKFLAAALCAATATGASAMTMEIDVAGQANGTITIDLFEDVSPLHAAQIQAIAEDGAYDGVVFHRVIDGFMAQTGDVEFGDSTEAAFDMRRAGTGGSDLPDIPLEATDAYSFTRGMVGMARAQAPNSANSQFFIMFQDGTFLDGDYTIIGEVTDGMDVVDAIKRGEGPNGAVIGEADIMQDVRVYADDARTEDTVPTEETAEEESQ